MEDDFALKGVGGWRPAADNRAPIQSSGYQTVRNSQPIGMGLHWNDLVSLSRPLSARQLYSYFCTEEWRACTSHQRSFRIPAFR
jgi:hypothetical protein